MPEETLIFEDVQPLRRLDSRRGGYLYLAVPAEVGAALPGGWRTRLICETDAGATLRCGLNARRDGSFFVIVSNAVARRHGLAEGARVAFALRLDPDPLGVEMPEVLAELLAEDERLRAAFDEFTDGRKRSLIHALGRIRDIDRQVMKAVAMLTGAERVGPPARKKQ